MTLWVTSERVASPPPRACWWPRRELAPGSGVVRGTWPLACPGRLSAASRVKEEPRGGRPTSPLPRPFDGEGSVSKVCTGIWVAHQCPLAQRLISAGHGAWLKSRWDYQEKRRSEVLRETAKPSMFLLVPDLSRSGPATLIAGQPGTETSQTNQVITLTPRSRQPHREALSPPSRSAPPTPLPSTRQRRATGDRRGLPRHRDFGRDLAHRSPHHRIGL
jgi:hypothetical protein